MYVTQQASFWLIPILFHQNKAKSFIRASHKAAKTVQATLHYQGGMKMIQKPGGDNI